MKFNKFLGQNFLKSRKIIQDIINAAELKSDDVILEVGPGSGILTEELLKNVRLGRIIAVEKDKKLVEFLKEKFKKSENLEIISDDILKFDPGNYSLLTKKYKIVANIPYYITSHFLRKFLETKNQPSLMVLMVQKEVAERIVSKNKQSLLSISVKVYGIPRIIKKVPAGAFFPKPNVDSAIILISNISKFFFGDVDKKKFFTLVKNGFANRRKMLKNNLKLADGLLENCGLLKKVRAEDLSPETWKFLYKKIYQ
jgi:16S rRNA (adenine1518-N6/adenine1519-N6)-dimethyltransferase